MTRMTTNKTRPKDGPKNSVTPDTGAVCEIPQLEADFFRSMAKVTQAIYDAKRSANLWEVEILDAWDETPLMKALSKLEKEAWLAFRYSPVVQIHDDLLHDMLLAMDAWYAALEDRALARAVFDATVKLNRLREYLGLNDGGAPVFLGPMPKDILEMAGFPESYRDERIVFGQVIDEADLCRANQIWQEMQQEASEER